MNARLSETPLDAWISPVDHAIRRVSRGRRLSPMDAEDFRSFVLFQLFRDDGRRLRRFRRESRRSTFLLVVVKRLYLDFRSATWGKWRPSAQARKLGKLAVELETLLYRDGLPVADAVEVVASRQRGVPNRATLLELAMRLPVRQRPSFVSTETAELAVPARRPDDESERAEAERALLDAFRDAVRELSVEERALLRRRFGESGDLRSMAEAARVPASRIYGRLRRALGKLRNELEARGVGGETVARLLESGGVEIDLMRWLSS